MDAYQIINELDPDQFKCTTEGCHGYVNEKYKVCVVCNRQFLTLGSTMVWTENNEYVDGGIPMLDKEEAKLYGWTEKK